MADKQFKTVGTVLKKQRVLLEKSKEDLARLVGVGERAYTYYESGDRKPELPAMITLSKELQIPNLVQLYGEQQGTDGSIFVHGNTDDLKQIVMMMATNVNMFVQSTTSRLESVEASSDKHGSNIKSLLDWKKAVDRKIQVIEDQLKPLVIEEHYGTKSARGKIKNT